MSRMPIRSDAEGDIVTVTIDSPETRNGLDLESIAPLHAAIREASAGKDARFLVIRGVPDWFCIGGSGRFMEYIMGIDAPERAALTRSVQAIVLDLLRSPLLTVAAVDGLAAGAGADLVLACDLALATEKARFSLLYARLGLVPDTGFVLLQRRLGWRAMTSFAESRVLRADEMVSLGIAEPAGDLLEGDRLARQLRRRFRHPPAAFAAAKGLRNAELFPKVEADLARAAAAQAEALEVEETRERLAHSAAAQRAAP